MQPDATGNSRPEFGGFASVMKQASAEQQPSPKNRGASPAPVQYLQEHEPYNNRNISSVIARITDDGPANLQNKREKTRSSQSSSRGSDGLRLVQDDVYTPSTARDAAGQQDMPQSFAFDGAGISDDQKHRGYSRQGKWQQIILLMVLVAVSAMGYMLYRLNLNTNELSLALEQAEEKMLLTGEDGPLPAHVLPGITGLDAAITELKQDLQVIKAGQQVDSRRKNMSIAGELKSHLMNRTVTTREANGLKVELDKIRNQVHQADDGIRNELSDAPSVRVKQAVKAIPESIQGKSSQYIVTLASFSSRDKAQAANEILQRSGALPLIEEVLVNGDILYRISVGGFSSRASADVFIAEANERYGFEGGWIREK